MVIREVAPSQVLFVSKNTEMGNGKQNDLKHKDVLFLRTDPKTGRETVQIQKSKKRNKRKQRRCARCNKMSCVVVMLVCVSYYELLSIFYIMFTCLFWHIILSIYNLHTHKYCTKLNLFFFQIIISYLGYQAEKGNFNKSQNSM